jgi:hypothetical protein
MIKQYLTSEYQIIQSRFRSLTITNGGSND